MLKDKIKETADKSLDGQKQEVARGQTNKSEEQVIADAPKVEDSINVLKEVLTAEFKNDPANRGYAGKIPEVIADLLNNPYTVENVEDQIVPARLAVLTQQVAENVHAGYSFSVDADGKVVTGDDFATALENAITEELKLPAYEGKTRQEGIMLMRTTSVEKVKTQVQATPRWAVIIKGIPFAPNIITAEELRELGF